MANPVVIGTAGAAVSAVAVPHCHGSLAQQLGVREAALHQVIGAEAAPAETGAVLVEEAILVAVEPEAVGKRYGASIRGIYR